MQTNRLTVQGEENRQRLLDYLKSKQILVSAVSLRQAAEDLEMSLSNVNHHMGVLIKRWLVSRPKGLPNHFIVKAGEKDVIELLVCDDCEDLQTVYVNTKTRSSKNFKCVGCEKPLKPAKFLRIPEPIK